MKLRTFFVSRTKQVYGKTLSVSESTFKVKVMSLWHLMNFCLRSSYLQTKIFHKNQIVQYLKNYKYQDVNQSHFRKPLQALTNAMKNNYPETAHTFFLGCSILSYFLCLNC